MTLPQFIFIFAGAFTIFMGITRFGFNRRKAQRVINIIGVIPTQVLYVAIGIALIVIAFTVDLGTL